MLDLARTLFYVGLILVPYGLEQLCYGRYISRNPARTAHRPAAVLGGYGLAYLWDAAHLAVLIAAGWRLIATTYPLTLWQGLGWALFLAGVALRIWALRELGPFYSASLLVYDDHRVVSSGPYRCVRHPLHLGTTAQIGGLAFFAPAWLAVPAAGLSIALTLYRNRAEDRLLLAHLGDAYRRYYLATWDPVDLVFWKRGGDV